MKSHELLRLVIDGVGTKQVASDMKVSTSLVYKWCQNPVDQGAREASGARNPLDRVMSLVESTSDRRPVEWLCGEVGGYFVERADVDLEEVDAECLRHTQALLSQFSELLQVISDSLANEARIDETEAREIRNCWQSLQSQGELFVRACEAGVFDPER